jgi:SPP1 family predicted phage head-tail adaptor
MTVWAAAMPKTGREFYRLANVNSEITEVFRIRYNSSVTPHARVKFGGRYFEVISVINPEERNKDLLLTCKGVV